VTGGNVKHADQVDMKTLGVVMEINGKVVTTGAGAAVLGHPAASVAMLANMLAERGEVIPAGTFIMTGGITEAIAVKAGDSVCVRYQDLGTVSMTFV
jgi:2-oxo-3-hexenedioate decarboxylase